MFGVTRTPLYSKRGPGASPPEIPATMMRVPVPQEWGDLVGLEALNADGRQPPRLPRLQARVHLYPWQLAERGRPSALSGNEGARPCVLQPIAWWKDEGVGDGGFDGGQRGADLLELANIGDLFAGAAFNGQNLAILFFTNRMPVPIGAKSHLCKLAP